MATVFTKHRERERLDDSGRRPRPTDRISDTTSVGLGVAWVVGYLGVGALEPTTHSALPVIAVVLAVAFHLGLFATAAGLIARRRWGITASLATAALFVAGTVACPTTGHHTVGLWWFGQMALSLALLVGSVVALSRTDVDAGDEESVPVS